MPEHFLQLYKGTRWLRFNPCLNCGAPLCLTACMTGNIRVKAASGWPVCAEPEDLEDPRVIQEHLVKHSGNACGYTENLNEERRDRRNLSLESPKQVGASGLQGEQAMWILPFYAEGENTRAV